MRIQSIAQPSIEAAQFPAVEDGTAYKQLPSILRFVQIVFPAHSRALRYLVGLLTLAQVEQVELSTIYGEVRGDAATVYAKGYEDLRQRLHLAYDTTHKYTLIFEALGLVFTQKLEGQLMLIIPLHSYHPPAGALDTVKQLRERYRSHRPKLGKLLKSVIERLQVMLESDVQQLPVNQTAIPSELVDTIQQALSDPIAQENSRQMALHIAASIAHFLPAERVQASLPVAKREDSPPPLKDQEDSEEGIQQLEESTVLQPQRQKSVKQVRQNLPNDHPRVDSVSCESTPRHSVGRFLHADALKRSAQDTIITPADLPAAAISAPTNLPVMVDSPAGKPSNGNGIGNNKNISIRSLPDSITDPSANNQQAMMPVDSPLPHPIVVSQARELAIFLEGKADEGNLGGYITLIRGYPPPIRMAALIATLERKHYPQGKGLLKKPGGYFTRCCQEYLPKSIPDRFADLVARCIHRPYDEVEAIVKTSLRPPGSRNRHSSREADESTPLKPIRGTHMDKATADALAIRISKEAHYAHVKGLRKVTHAEGAAYIVEVTIGPKDCVFASFQEWEHHHAQVQALGE